MCLLSEECVRRENIWSRENYLVFRKRPFVTGRLPQFPRNYAVANSIAVTRISPRRAVMNSQVHPKSGRAYMYTFLTPRKNWAATALKAELVFGTTAA